MKKKTKPVAKKVPLPKMVATKRMLSWKMPHILLSVTRDKKSGQLQKHVREGGSRQCEFTTEMSYETAPGSTDDVFAIKHTNQLNFAGAIINVINDEVVLLPELRLVPTLPTASEYLARVGKKTLVGVVSTPDVDQTRLQGKEIFRVGRISLTLP